MDRRIFLAATTAVGALALLGRGLPATAQERFAVTRTQAEWRAMLSDQEYRVMRDEGTERAFSSPLDREKRPGVYHCRGCDLPLFGSDAKFDSGTGWPSFYQPLSNAVATRADKSLFGTRTEVNCRRCGSHLGHVFDDGPEPTGKRFCMNGVALVFKPA